ncbi:TetR family transcriptional regulator [Georgenia sp. Z1491]|uniref:TetR/AcrR family transcriptional regulator n=1 Tax=Georgenia sp. Z1491 TaxID=3416707 RepID=UPI003CF920BC
MARRTAQENRTTIRAAARELFAEQGYDRATVRAIAARAGVDPAVVIRSFGSKADLFAATVDVELGIDLTGDAPTTPDEIGELIARHVLRRWEQDDVLLVLLRTAVEHEPARDRLVEVMSGQVVPMIQRLGVPADEARLRATLVATQVIGLAMVRLVARVEPLASASHDDVVRWLAPTFQRYLTDPL